MPHPLLGPDRIDREPADYLEAVGRESIGTVIDRFGAHTQDSGNESWSIDLAGTRFFVKTAGRAGRGAAYYDRDGRIALLRTAIEVAGSVTHPALPPLRHVIESPGGPMLVYDWRPGELLRAPADKRDDPRSGLQRFRRLPPERILQCLDTVMEVHRLLAAAGWIACDFYDGCLIYDFAAHSVSIIDLDTYHRGPFVNQMGRLFGSTRFMAPEEFERGATIDERTTVFTLGRAVLVLAPAAALSVAGSALHDVVVTATEADPGGRFGTVADLVTAWRAARAG